MFGQTHKLTDSSLYLMHDMVEKMLSTTLKAISETPKENKEELLELLSRAAYFQEELSNFEDEINKQCKHHFQFSIEELYNHIGQYDEFVDIEFHKFSDSTRKFGRNIGGILVYGKSEKANLQAIIDFGSFPRTNDYVKIDVSSNYNLDHAQHKELIETGFKSGDVHKIFYTNIPSANTYTQKGKKDIPNTIPISIDAATADLCKLTLFNLNMRINNGGVLIEGEQNQFWGYNIYYAPKLKKVSSVNDKIYDQNGNIKNDIRYYELFAKKVNSDISKDELSEFESLFNKRRIDRLKILEQELKNNNINSLEAFKVDYPQIYTELYFTAPLFDEEVLTITPSPVPIYWDFKSYLHIYLRHCDVLQPGGLFKAKTTFSYRQEDIRRILRIAVEKLESKIQERLSQGLEFRTHGKKALYFNGNFYSMRVERNGRIDSFHPYEAK
jgi:hypothetical protein